MRMPLAVTLLVAGVLLGQEPSPWLDPSRSPSQRAADLVSRMTLSEKVGQMVHAAPAIPRLGVPAHNYWNEVLHGVARAGHSTVFPQAIGMAATWDPDLLHRVADTLSTEARAKNNLALRLDQHGTYQGLTCWSPNINLLRDPRWGRGQETYGEDPFLTGRLAVAFIRGLQGDDPTYLKAVATPKHFAVHSGPERLRHVFDAAPSETDLRDSYLPHFEAAVREGGAWSLMAAYNRVYGVPAAASTFLLQDVARREWGFKGYVVSDCWGLSDIFIRHKVVKTPEEAAALSLKGGCDLECGDEVYGSLERAVGKGLVTEAQIDTSLGRVFEARFRLGLFDPPERVPYARIPESENGSPAHGALALTTAREAMVLLRNDGTLPLDRTRLRRVAVVGPNADVGAVFLGNYAGRPVALTTVYEALREKLGPGVRVDLVRGVGYAASLSELEPLPDLVLEHDGRLGLRGEYFANRDLQGTPAHVREDHGVSLSFNAEDGYVPEGLPVQDGSIRWTGEFVAPRDGAYTLVLHTPNGVRLWLDGKAVVDQWEEKERPDARVRLELKAGQRVPLRLEYVHGRTSQAALTLFWDRLDLDLTPQVLDRVREADAIIFVGGLTGELEGEQGAGPDPLEGLKEGDRITIEVPRIQTAMMQSLQALKKPLVFVNMTGSASAMPWEADHVPAILQAWYPGQAGAQAVAEALLGEINPGGRLPFTIYGATSDLPDFTDYAMAGRTYRYFRGRALFPFGHGLSYTTFGYGALALDRARVAREGVLDFTVEVRNQGALAGDEVVQAYVKPLHTRGPRALKDLRAFQRVTLAPGETRRLRLSIPAASLRHWDPRGHRYRVDPGLYELQIGASSGDIRLRAPFRIQP